MKKLLKVLIILMFMPCIVFASDEEKKIFAYSDLKGEVNIGVAGHDDGSYVVTGYKSEYDEENYEYIYEGYLVKYDKDDNVIWKSTDAKEYEILGDVEITSDGGYIALVSSYNTNLQLMVKFDANGKKVWESEDFPQRQLSRFRDIEIRDNGEILLIGTFTLYDFQPNGMIARYKSDGTFIEFKEYGGNDTESFNGGSVTKDGGLIVGGYAHLYDSNDRVYKYYPIVVKYDKDFNVLWTYQGERSETLDVERIICSLYTFDVTGFEDVIELSDDSFIGVGNREETKYGVDPDIGNTGNYDTTSAMIVKLDKTGKLVWGDFYIGDLNSSFNDVVETKSGKIFVVGQAGHRNLTLPVPTRDCSSSAFYFDALFFEYDKDGKRVEENVYDGTKSEILENITETEDDVYVAVGDYSSDDIDEIDLVDDNDGLIITLDKEEVEEEPVVPVEPEEDEKIENPKTGVEDYVFVLILVITTCVVIYNVVDSVRIFRKL